jgi:hypothetical protein
MVERAQLSIGRRLWISVLGLTALAALAIAVGLKAEGARAAGVTEFSMSVSNTQAGGHPDWEMNISFEDRSAGSGVCACEDVEKVDISAPTGLIGNPHAVPRCTLLQYGRHQCPPETQIGIVNPKLGALALQIPMYNMEPHPDQAGLVAFETPLINTPVFIDLNARTDSDYGLNSSSGGIFHLLPIHGLEVHLWGVPGSPTHDVSRWPNPQEGLLCIDKPYPEPCGAPVEFNGPIKPLLQNPTSCGEPLTGGLTLTYYDFQSFHADAPMDATTGCDQLSFDPSITVKPTTTQADTASGVDIDLVVPQTQNPTTPTPSQIRSTTVTLPEGFSVNPNAADGKTVCTDAQGAFGTRDAAQCPEASKVGTVTIDSSALPGPIGGAIYLGESKPGDKYRLFLTGDGYSTHVKLAGSVHMDPTTGQVVTEFDELPQSPLSEFNMHFFGAERGLLATPNRCGTYAVTSTFVPWDSALADHTSNSFFKIDSGPNGGPCPAATRPFTPSFRAGMADNTAGVHSSFGLKVGRPDGDQNLSGLEVVTPPGFSATLAGLSYCPDSVLAMISSPGYPGTAEQNAAACPASSQVGTVTTELGAGTRPLYAPGKVYFAGPYHGAPLSIATVIPAVSGPYDLGNVVVRTKITVDPTTAQVTTTADPLPQIIDGIPLRVRGIQVDLDRPGFALNPTNCAPKSIDASVLGIEGAAASLSNPFQVANCADLPYGPKLTLRLSGGVKRRGHPAVKATFTAKPGEANTSSVKVALPAGELLDNAHIGNVCTRVQFAADACPPSSALGTAVVSTPILDAPLKGNVYLRSSSHHLPDLALDLEGQIDFTLVGRVDTTKNGALRTSFEGAPDVPVNSLVLVLAGGAKGLLQNSKSLCGAAKDATTTMVGQNGAVVKTKTELQTSCGSKARSKRHSERKAKR